ncbi:hypothetical protein FRAAL0447 [Frankia alni ACN14a]|uniref:Uncharacterized protein n=1 Tax=Frankia alni (strain DSM 45986 / CECT 9034 / ACN14a) TaxID=326424 RepID=Q0RTH6_FRAAA|nr:hypothetical protein FRAAL0447 [Frankia alni ACN14a]
MAWDLFGHVVPARAGIFLRIPASDIRDGGRPRPRGDLPPLTIGAGSYFSSSPPARGSSFDRLGDERHLLVVPARAGIFRQTT